MRSEGAGGRVTVAITLSTPVLASCGSIVQQVTIQDARSGRELARLQLVTEDTGRATLRTEDGSPFPVELTHEEIVRLVIKNDLGTLDIAA